MRLANLAAFRKYAANLEKHNISLVDRLARLDKALEFSDRFLSPGEFQRCADFVSNYGED
jgi:hypothetical protein